MCLDIWVRYSCMPNVTCNRQVDSVSSQSDVNNIYILPDRPSNVMFGTVGALIDLYVHVRVFT